MSIVVGYIPTPQGEAALERGLAVGRAQDKEVVVVNFSRGDALVDDKRVYDDQLAELTARLERSGARCSIRRESRPKNPADELMDAAQELAADMIVIGLRRRSPTGKLLFGSTAQRVLLEAECDVLAVKAPRA